MLRTTWGIEMPSYLRSYLDNGLWGSDPLWDGVARNAFSVFLYLYMLPERVAGLLRTHIAERKDLRDEDTFASYLTSNEELQSAPDFKSSLQILLNSKISRSMNQNFGEKKFLRWAKMLFKPWPDHSKFPLSKDTPKLILLGIVSTFR